MLQKLMINHQINQDLSSYSYYRKSLPKTEGIFQNIITNIFLYDLFFY